jgi:quercetin dioxygenase-like cupin family protein
MKLWNLTTLPPSTQKETDRAPRPDAPRVESDGRRIPRVLFSSPECRAVIIELQSGEEMGEHRVRERALVQVVSGSVTIEHSGSSTRCDAGTLVMLDPSEPHAILAETDARLLLVLAPWTRGEHLPRNATADAANA